MTIYSYFILHQKLKNNYVIGNNVFYSSFGSCKPSECFCLRWDKANSMLYDDLCAHSLENYGLHSNRNVVNTHNCKRWNVLILTMRYYADIKYVWYWFNRNKLRHLKNNLVFKEVVNENTKSPWYSTKRKVNNHYFPISESKNNYLSILLGNYSITK